MERKYYSVLTVLWLVFITTLSLVSFDDNKFSTFKNTDKIVHFSFYFVLTLLLLKSFNKNLKHRYLIVMLIAVFYGIIIEVLQENITLTREGDFYDVIANTFGATCAVLLNKYLFKSIFPNVLKN